MCAHCFCNAPKRSATRSCSKAPCTTSRPTGACLPSGRPPLLALPITEDQEMPLSTGQTLRNRYRIDSLLGQGGMGAVYQAWDYSLNLAVAIKENLDASSRAQAQFSHEAHILAHLQHANL